MGFKKIGGFHTPTTLGGLRDLTKDKSGGGTNRKHAG